MCFFSARMMPLGAVVIFMKLAIPRPMIRILPSGWRVPRDSRSMVVFAYSHGSLWVHRGTRNSWPVHGQSRALRSGRGRPQMCLHLWRKISIIISHCILEDELAIAVQKRSSGLSTVSFSDAPAMLSSFWMHTSSLVNCCPKGAGLTIGGPRSAAATSPVDFAATESPTDMSCVTAHFVPQMLSAG